MISPALLSFPGAISPAQPRDDRRGPGATRLEKSLLSVCRPAFPTLRSCRPCVLRPLCERVGTELSDAPLRPSNLAGNQHSTPRAQGSQFSPLLILLNHFPESSRMRPSPAPVPDAREPRKRFRSFCMHEVAALLYSHLHTAPQVTTGTSNSQINPSIDQSIIQSLNI